MGTLPSKEKYEFPLQREELDLLSKAAELS